jgi:hypothetical protein
MRNNKIRFVREGIALALFLLCRAGLGGAEVVFAKGDAPQIVFQPHTDLEQRAEGRLAEYLGKVLGKSAQTVARIDDASSGTPVFVLAADGREAASGISAPRDSPEAFALETRVVGGRSLVIAVGRTVRGLKRAVQRLIVESEQSPAGLVIPELKMAESPWIPQREWALCPWDPNFPRAVFSNPNADKRLNVYNYGDEQIASYVAMFDSFGFSGCQLLEICGGFHDRGSPEAYQSVLQRYARASHRQGQDVTYWVWAAQFDGYGWVDSTVTYTPRQGMTAFEDPKVRATFEKYYDHYAKMAPDVDRLVAHFYDPGSLKSQEDVFSYLALLRDKFKAGNPNVKLGVDFWAVAKGNEAGYMQQLADHGFGDALLLETSLPSYWPAGKREALHQEAKRRGLDLGVWGWCTAEMETDRTPSMFVNAHLLSHFFGQIKHGADRIHPLTYWSEMEAYHLNNIFTMYATAQLLWNPERDPDEILREIAEGIYGPRNGEPVFRALKLIEDVRTGPAWDTFWRYLPGARLGTEDPAADLRRADEAIAAFEKMTPDGSFVAKFPLPFPPATFIQLTLPHLRQIRQFADFRLKVLELRAAAMHGATKAQLTQLAQAAWHPVPDYNTWIGEWGQPEEVMQEKILEEIAGDLGIEVTVPGWMRFRDAERLLEAVQNRQRFTVKPWQFTLASGFMQWATEKVRDRLQLLIESGAIEKIGDNAYRLANWNDYRMQR